MKTDIQIAQEAKLMPITEVAEQLGISFDDLELYGKYKAKLSDKYLESIQGNQNAKLVWLLQLILRRPEKEKLQLR